MTNPTVPPEILEQWRQEFEREVTNEDGYLSRKDDDGNYGDLTINSYWQLWIKARQTVRIELPSYSSFDLGVIKRVEKSIKAQGYQVSVGGGE